MRKVSGLKINNVIFCDVTIFMIWCLIILSFIHDYDNDRQVLNQLHTHAYNIVS